MKCFYSNLHIYLNTLHWAVHRPNFDYHNVHTGSVKVFFIKSSCVLIWINKSANLISKHRYLIILNRNCVISHIKLYVPTVVPVVTEMQFGSPNYKGEAGSTQRKRVAEMRCWCVQVAGVGWGGPGGYKYAKSFELV